MRWSCYGPVYHEASRRWRGLLRSSFIILFKKEKNFGLILLNWGFAYPSTVFDYSQDEAMHSGVDVEAFQAALNRDIGGDVSTSQFSGSDAGMSRFYSLFALQP